MEKKLEGKTAIIIGSDAGIGQSTAIALARDGANVAISYLYDEDGAQQTFHQVKQHGQRALVVQADTSDEEQVEALFDSAIKEFGQLYILVHIAGMGAAGTRVAGLSTERWRDAFATNVDSCFFCARRFVNHRLENGGNGKIIHITPVQQQLARAGGADYECTKGAILNLSRTLALEVAEHGICVNTLVPGIVHVPYAQEEQGRLEARAAQVLRIPLRRAARPEEIARLAHFLASPDSDYCSGATFTMDGALSQGPIA